VIFGDGTGPIAAGQPIELGLVEGESHRDLPSRIHRHRKLTADQIKAAVRVVETLAARYPRAFYVRQIKRRPLKTGIHLDLTADGAFTTDEIALALRWYVSNPGYRGRLLAGAERVDLLGAPPGTVTETDAEQAAKSLERLRAKRLARKASPPAPSPARSSTPARSPAPASPPPRRSGLADLRAAAAARKAAQL
jgi:sRNA-binding protein